MVASKDLLGHGTYGSVRSSTDGDAVKQTTVFENDCLGSNFSEMVFVAASIGRPVQNVVSFSSVSMTERPGVISMTMERGAMTLRQSSHTQSWAERKLAIRDIILDLSTSLRHLHATGITHCDLKPDNVVVTSDGRLRLIDFGSCRFWNRPTAPSTDTRKVMCTYGYCAPEALQSGMSPDPACDAYSLGVTLFVYLFRQELFPTTGEMTREAASVALNNLHRSSIFPFGMIRRRRSLPDQIYQIIGRLLDPDPAKRLRIDVLAHEFSSVVPATVKLVLDDGAPVPRVHHKHCRMLIGDLFNACRDCACEAAFALAVNLVFRFASRTSWPVSADAMRACFGLALATNNPDHFEERTDDQQDYMIAVMKVLDFQIYADTCDWLLLSLFNQTTLDMPLLCSCMMDCHARTPDTVGLYMCVLRSRWTL